MDGFLVLYILDTHKREELEDLKVFQVHVTKAILRKSPLAVWSFKNEWKSRQKQATCVETLKQV